MISLHSKGSNLDEVFSSSETIRKEEKGNNHIDSKFWPSDVSVNGCLGGEHKCVFMLMICTREDDVNYSENILKENGLP